MARYAAADPQVMGVLRDIVGSLRGLERRMTALEERSSPAPAPDKGRGGAVAIPTSGVPAKKSRRRRRRKKRDRVTDPQSVADKRTSMPAARARAGPLGPAVVPQCTTSGKRGAAAVSRAAPPPPRRGQVAPCEGCTHGHPGGDRSG